MEWSSSDNYDEFVKGLSVELKLITKEDLADLASGLDDSLLSLIEMGTYSCYSSSSDDSYVVIRTEDNKFYKVTGDGFAQIPNPDLSSFDTHFRINVA